MQEIVHEMESGTHKEHEQIANHAVAKITADNQRHRELHILREENMVEFAVCVPCIHIQKGVEADNLPEKNIHQKPADKPDYQAGFLPAHKAERRREYD